MSKVIPLKAFADNYIWVIPDEEQKTFLCVDPGSANPVLEYAKDKTLTTIFVTHHHTDHAGGLLELLQYFPECKAYAPEDARIPSHPQIFAAKTPLNFASYHFEVLATPGHTATHISFYEPQQHWLFCGDTLFSAGCGRVFDGSMATLHQAICLYKNLPDDTQVFCGHEYTRKNLKFAQSVEPNNADIKLYAQYLSHHTSSCSLPSTISLEKKINPFFRTDDPEVIQYALEKGESTQDSFHIFKALRLAKDNF